MSEAAHHVRAPIAYVLGVPRSGTTLLTHLLAQHPAILCLPEHWLMLALESFGSAPVAHPGDPRLIRLATDGVFGHSRTEILGSVARTMYRALLSQSGKQLIVDKTPRYYHCLPFIKRAVSEAKFIWIRRNPLDVAASYKTTWNIDVGSLISECLDIPHFFDFALGFRLLADFADANDVCIVSYEDLVANPQAALERIFDHLNIPSCRVEGIDRSALAHQEGLFGDKKILQTVSIHTNSVGSFRLTLSSFELKAILQGLGQELFGRLGYKDDYYRAARAVGVAISDRSEATYQRALHLLARRAALSERGLSEWYIQSRQVQALTKSLKKAEAERGALIDSLREVGLERDTAIAARDAILASRSWRITSGLRKLRTLLGDTLTGALLPRVHFAKRISWRSLPAADP